MFLSAYTQFQSDDFGSLDKKEFQEKPREQETNGLVNLYSFIHSLFEQQQNQ